MYYTIDWDKDVNMNSSCNLMNSYLIGAFENPALRLVLLC